MPAIVVIHAGKIEILKEPVAQRKKEVVRSDCQWTAGTWRHVLAPSFMGSEATNLPTGRQHWANQQSRGWLIRMFHEWAEDAVVNGRRNLGF